MTKVILLQNIRGIGQVGDVKDVNDGYARNFLFPRKAAKPLTEGTLKDVNATKAKKLEIQAMAQKETQELAQQLTGTTIELTGKASEKGKLFAAISEVTAAGHTFKLPEHIKTTGDHPVVLELAHGISASVTVRVTAR